MQYVNEFKMYFLYLMQGSAISTTRSPCEGLSDSSCSPSGTYSIADPFDCTKFYFCSDGALSSDSYACIDGTYYDEDFGGCVPDNGVPCTPKCSSQYNH